MNTQVCHLTSAHSRRDVRIFEKECKSLSKVYKVSLIVADGVGNETIDGVQILDVGRRPDNKILRIILTPLRVYRRSLKLHECHYFHFHDPELLLVGFVLQYFHKKKVIYDVHEDVPEDILLKNWIPVVLRKMISNVYRMIEHSVARRLSAIICATPFIKSRFLSVNPNSYDIKNYPILQNQISREKINLSSIQYDICYIGMISEHRGIFDLLKILDSMDVRVALAGPFESDTLRASLVKSKNWNKVSYQGILNRSEIQTLLDKSFIGVVVLRRTPTFITSLPIKLFEYMAAAMPVIASNFPGWKDIIEKSNCGVCIEPEDTEQFLIAIQKLLADKESAINMGRQGLEAVRRMFSWEVEAQTLLQLYKAL